MTPPKPAAFTPEGAPDGVEIRFVNFMAGRPKIRPRSIFVHTNGASREGSVDSAWNWAHAAPNRNTVPHYQVDRAHNGILRARKMLPSDRQGIANATITSGHKDWPRLTQQQRDSILAAGNRSIATWSLAIETADLGWPNPGGACGFEEQQGEMIAAILAYEAITHGFPLVRLPVWDGAGVAAHTEPFTRPFTTLYVKPCPGDAKKAELWSWLLPRAVEIQDAWLGHPIVIPQPSDGTYPPGSRDVMYPIDYGIAGTDSWWTEMAITPKGLQWSGGPSVESQKIRQIFVAVPMPRAPRLQNDADVVTLMRTIGTFGDCPSTFLSNPGLREAWSANRNPGR